MNVLVIDGQGGRIGKQLVEELLLYMPKDEISAVGTNSIATAAMIKGGAVKAATGENAVIVGCRTADVIIGPIGILSADALLGEITPKMAKAVGQSKADKILIPVNKCGIAVAGTINMSLSDLIKDAVNKAMELQK